MTRLRTTLNRLRRRHDRGALEIELAGITLIVMGLLYVIVYAGRLGLAQLTVQDAATQAGRAASSARTAADATAAAQDVVDSTIASGWVQCDPELTMDTAAFSSDPGTPSEVTGTLRCVVDMHDVAVAGVPASVTLSCDFSSPLDTFREHQ